MDEMPQLILAALAGILLGILFFGGLWFTVKKTVRAKIPALWVFGSFILRNGIVLVGFYFIGAGDWRRLVACLIGFTIARFLVVRFTKSIDAKKIFLEKEVYNEA